MDRLLYNGWMDDVLTSTMCFINSKSKRGTHWSPVSVLRHHRRDWWCVCTWHQSYKLPYEHRNQVCWQQAGNNDRAKEFTSCFTSPMKGNNIHWFASASSGIICSFWHYFRSLGTHQVTDSRDPVNRSPFANADKYVSCREAVVS